MKKLIFLLILFGCLVFCSCAATVDVEYGIDEDNNAYTEINLNINAGDMSDSEKYTLKGVLRNLENHYRIKCGFESEYDFFTENKNYATLSLKKAIPADSFEDAFDNLKKMLCDEELTLFSEVSCEHSDTEGNYTYRIDGRIDLNRVIENTYNSGISDKVKLYTEEVLSQCSFSTTLAMPDNTKLYRLSVTESTEIYHEGRIFEKPYGALSSVAEHLGENMYTTLIIGFGVLTLVGAAGIITGVILIKNGKKKN